MSAFDDIVGQEIPKSQLNFNIESFEKNGLFLPTILVAPKGNGKTSLANAVGRCLKDTETKRIKPFLAINSSTIGNLSAFIENIVVKKIAGRQVTLFFDEASELPKDLTMTLLTILDTENASKKSFLSFKDTMVEFDLRKITWLFATSEIHKIFVPLLDRLERIDLQDYSQSQLIQIVKRGAFPLQISDTVFESLTYCLRGNGRNAKKTGEKIRLFLETKNRGLLGLSDWEQMKKQLYIMPLGLSPLEVQILRILKNHQHCSLTSLCAKTGMSRSSLQRDVEVYLLRRGLMEIDSPRGRKITTRGKELLKEMEENGLTDETILVE